MLIRPATPSDVDGVNAVNTASGRGNWSAGTFIADPDRVVLIAESEGQIVGVAKTHLHARPDGEAPAGHYLGGVTVAPAHRRSGVASALTLARLTWIWSRSDRAYYFTNEHNAASIRLHESFGFLALGTFDAIHGVTADDGQSRLLLFAAFR